MPNVVVEYTDNIRAEADIPGLLKAIADTIQSAGQGAIPIAAVRIRAIELHDWYMGDGKPEYAFVNLTVKLAKGRPEEDKVRTFNAVWEVVKAHLKPVDESRVLAISMDVEEFGDRLAYKQNRLHELFGTKPFAKVMS